MVSAKLPPHASENESPIRSVFCLKRKSDMRKIEEIEDCFIIEFDPTETNLHGSPLSLSKTSHLHHDADADPDVCVLAEKGQVACRDYPHPRHLCVKFPFHTTSHELHCPKCFCYICDTEAPCKNWITGEKHCDANRHGVYWISLRRARRKKLKS